MNSLYVKHYEQLINPLGSQSSFGDKPVKFQVVCPQNGTAVLKKVKKW